MAATIIPRWRGGAEKRRRKDRGGGVLREERENAVGPLPGSRNHGADVVCAAKGDFAAGRTCEGDLVDARLTATVK